MTTALPDRVVAMLTVSRASRVQIWQGFNIAGCLQDDG